MRNYRSAEHLHAHQDVHGIRRTVVLTIDGAADAARNVPANDFPFEAAWAACRAYPDRLIPGGRIRTKRAGNWLECACQPPNRYFGPAVRRRPHERQASSEALAPLVAATVTDPLYGCP